MNRKISSRSLLSLLLLALTAGVVFLLSGCAPASEEAAVHEENGVEHGEGGDPAHETAEGGSAGSQVHTYDIRGEIIELPDPADPLSGFYVRHESIDEWVSMDGEIDPMSSMTMPFPLADDLSLEGIEAGDKVLFTLRVAYDDDPTFQVTRVEKLPDDTVLKLRTSRSEE